MKHDRAMIRHHRARMIANRVREFGFVIRPWGKAHGFFSKTKPLNCSGPCCQSPTKANPYRGKERQAVKTTVWGEIE